MKCYNCGAKPVVENTDRCQPCLDIINIFRNAVTIYQLRTEVKRREAENVRTKLLEK